MVWSSCAAKAVFEIMGKEISNMKNNRKPKSGKDSPKILLTRYVSKVQNQRKGSPFSDHTTLTGPSTPSGGSLKCLQLR
jgi:hypothetical protein